MSRDHAQKQEQISGTARCGARTRAGGACRSTAMRNGKCRIHGGLSTGAPRGGSNGRFVDGYWTQDAVEERRFIRLLLNGNLGGRA